MRIEFTVSGPAGSRDVAVTAAATTPLAALLPGLAGLVGGAPDEPAWLGSRRLSGALGDCGLRNGVVVSFGPTLVAAAVGLHAVRIVGGGVAAEPVALQRHGLTIGRDPECDVVLADDRASRRHATLRAGPAGVRIDDLGSTNGTTVDGVPAAAGTLVASGAVIRIGDSLLSVASPDPPEPAALMRGADGALQVNRAPRANRPSPAAVIDRHLPPRGAPPGRVQWFAALVPAVAGGLLAWLLASPMFLLFALLSPVLLLGTAAGDRLHWRRERRRADATARLRRAAVDEQIGAALRAETASRRASSPDPFALLDVATSPGSRLWEREPGDHDHLVVRVGSADAESATTVRDAAGSSPAGVVPTVPALVDLRAGPLGLAGAGDVVDGIARWLVGQLAVLHAPAEVEIVPVPGDVRGDGWAWCRWLPHLRSAPPVGPDAVAVTLASLAALRDRRRATAARYPTGRWGGPWTVIVADRLTGADAAALADLLADGAEVGLTAVCVAGTTSALPGCCRTVATVDTASGCRLTLRDPAGEITVLVDRVTDAWAEQVARALAPFTDARAAGALPAHCRWAELVAVSDPDEVAGAWATADGGARAVLGLGRDGPVIVDLVTDGPHALVAGTTGAGKSELLRTLVVSLAAGYPPDRLSFLLVDYKGGAAFADAVRLPHTTGVLTDLDAVLTGRALHSLDAELRRRERLFAAAGAADLTEYRTWVRTRPGGTPVARLVIVVDEFAELAADLPDFVTGLVGVARRGRSLGVHLVLATQRPGSVVSAEIRANTALRISLRVTEAVESTDVIDGPDAALIDPGLPGRAYARIGNRLVELQAARVTAEPAESRPVVEPLGAWRRAETRRSADHAPNSELQRVVAVLAEAARRARSPEPHRPWLPPLPARLPLAGLAGPDSPATPLGRLDRPADQAQPVFGLDPAGDSVLVVGAARSGRTTTLLTAALATTRDVGPEAVQLHLIDSTGTLVDTLATLPHVGTSITRAGVELLPRLLERLVARSPVASARLRSLLLVDDWDLVTSSRDESLAAQWTELLTSVVRATGPELTVLVAGGRTLLLPRFAAGFASRLVLPLADATDYGMAGLPPSVPATPVPGSGVRLPEGTAFRIAHAGTDPTLASARAEAAAITRRWAGRAAGPGVLRLRALPVRVTLDTALARTTHTDGIVLGLAGDAAAPCVVDVVGRRARLLLAGPARSGRSTMLMTAASEAARLGHNVAVAAPPRSPLREHARSLGAHVIEPAAPEAPVRPTLLLVDDVDACDEQLGDMLVGWLRDPVAPVGAIVAGRSDELVTNYRGLVAEVRRDRCGVLLRPGPLDGELLGVRIRPSTGPAPPGRGVVVGDPRWGGVFAEADANPIQVACP